jgi:8-oxo-dGTP diphosphatase
MPVTGRDHIGVGVGAMVADRAGRFFLAQRGLATRNEAGTWEFPGGRVHFGERMENSIVREFQEEYGIRIELFGQLAAFDHILPAEAQHWVSVTYLARLAAGTPAILEPAKCAEIGWFALDALPSPLSQITLDNVEKYRSDGIRWDNFREWLGGARGEPG